MNAPSCGLITQTDAERLCANLLQIHGKGPKRSANSVPSNQYERLYSIKVQHKCFGKCSGTLYPTLYIAPQAECILCDTCQAIFSPRTFVSHGHKSEENRICHWGFNSDNWRSYLKIRSTEDRKAHEELELYKEKFQSNSKKRSTQINNDGPSMTTEKRAKLSAPSSSNETYTYPYPAMKKDNHYADFAFNTCLPRPTPLPLTLPVESMSSNRYFIEFLLNLFLIVFRSVALDHHHYVLFVRILLHLKNQQQISMVRTKDVFHLNLTFFF